jgi:hypothetical protein
MHTALVSRLIKDRSAWELAYAPVAKPSVETVTGAVVGSTAFAGV